MTLYGNRKRFGNKKVLGRKPGGVRLCSAVMAGCLVVGSLTGCGSTGMEDVSESLAGTGGHGTVAGGSVTDQSVSGEGQSAYTSAGGIIVASEMFTERDLSGEYNAAEADQIVLSGKDVTITKEGVYLLQGTLADGMVIVDAGQNDKVQLVLDGVEIDNDTDAAIYVKEADKVFVTLAEGSENFLTSRGYTVLDGENIDGVIYAKSDLVVNGSGSLTVNAVEGHGIVSKDDLKITGGSVIVTAEKQGLSGNDSVRIGGGTIQVTSGKDGIHAENNGDTEKGYVFLSDGTLQISSGGDGISAGSVVQVDGGTVDILAGGGSDNRTVAVDENGDAVSAKGIKATAELVINQGVFSIDAQDDAIHSDLNVIINSGGLSLATGDDGIHANEMTSITGGSIHISDSYEGIEGNQVEISGGTIQLYATDDGVNAAGGNDQSGFGGMFGGEDRFGHGGNRGPVDRENGENNNLWTGDAGRENRKPESIGEGNQETGSGEDGDNGVSVESEVPYIRISGGVIHVRADGDGLDSNGDLLVSGGELYVSGPENGANGALDYERNGQITGGIVVAAGSSGMAVNFGNTSTQGSILVTTADHSSGTAISLLDSDGKELASYTAECRFNSVVVSCPELVLGGAYTIVTGEEHTEVTLSDSLIYGSGSGMGGFGNGRMPGGEQPQMPEGGMPGGEQPQMPEGGMPGGEQPQMPEGGMPGGEQPQMPEGGMPGGEQRQMR